jgi:hypothetical protein
MLKLLPAEIYQHHIFPRLELPEILYLTDLNPSIAKHTKNYLLDWGLSLGMKDISDYRHFLDRLKMKKDLNKSYDQIIDKICKQLLQLLLEDCYVHDKDEILSFYRKEMQNLRSYFDYCLTKVTYKLGQSEILYLMPSIFKDSSELYFYFYPFTLKLKDMMKDKYFKMFFPQTPHSEEYESIFIEDITNQALEEVLSIFVTTL